MVVYSPQVWLFGEAVKMVGVQACPEVHHGSRVLECPPAMGSDLHQNNLSLDPVLEYPTLILGALVISPVIARRRGNSADPEH